MALIDQGGSTREIDVISGAGARTCVTRLCDRVLAAPPEARCEDAQVLLQAARSAVAGAVPAHPPRHPNRHNRVGGRVGQQQVPDGCTPAKPLS